MLTVVRFHLRGKTAHFRRFYTNSSSLTYPVPPPTVVRGIVGAALGLACTDYPVVLADLTMGIRPLETARTIFQGVNLLMVKSGSDRELRGLEPRTQVPTQLLLPETFDRALGFEVVLVPGARVTAEELAAALRSPAYPPTLGTAYCLGWVEVIGLATAERRTADSAEVAPYLGVLYADLVSDLRLRDGQRLSRDRYPVRLSPDRRIEAARDLLVDLAGEQVTCRYGGEWLELGDERWGIVG